MDSAELAIINATGVHIEIAVSARPALEKAAVALANALINAGIRPQALVAVPDDQVDKREDKTFLHVFVGVRG